MSRVLEVPYGQLGDMTKRQPMNLSVLRVNDGDSLSTSYAQAKKCTAMLPTTSPQASMMRSRSPHKFTDAPAAPLIRDVSFARWDVMPLPAHLTLDDVLKRVVEVNRDASKYAPILKIKVRFTDASEITFVRQDVSKANTLKYSNFYSALDSAPPLPAAKGAKNPLMNSASAAFVKRGGSVALPSINTVTYPGRDQRKALFRRVDPNGNGILSLAELDKAVVELWPRFDHKPAIMRAYKAADLDGSGLLGFDEFEHFLKYLVNFNAVWKAFKKQDRNDDGRVSLGEFVATAKRLEPNKSDAELSAAFKKMDKNDGGFVLFEEFCDYMVRKRPNIIGPIPPQPMNRLAATAPAGKRKAALDPVAKRVHQLEMPSAAKRKQLFSRIDPNGNGLLSLAELDKGIIELWPHFNNKPAIMRAYKAADNNGTGFIGKREFEYFLRYLVHYNNLWAAFADVDASGDRRISLQEFLAVRDRLQVGNEAEARAAFLQMDRNHGGFVLFEEFCDWMAKNKALFELKFTQPAPPPSKPKKAAAPAPLRVHDLTNTQRGAMKLPPAADRKQLFNRIDPNGNGMLSLAELDKAIIELWPQFDNKPAVMRAYKAADKNGTGFIGRKEFNFFLRYLVHYNNLWAAFADVDTNDDRRVSRSEFLKGAKMLRITAPEAELLRLFEKMDKNGGGYVLFNEFCAALSDLKAQTDGE